MIVRTRWHDRARDTVHELELDLPVVAYSRRLAQEGGPYIARRGAGIKTACGVLVEGPVRLDPQLEVTCEDGCGVGEPHPLAPRRLGAPAARRSPVAVGERMRGVA